MLTELTVYKVLLLMLQLHVLSLQALAGQAQVRPKCMGTLPV